MQCLEIPLQVGNFPKGGGEGTLAEALA